MRLDELSRILRDVDPAAVLVDRTVLARVVQNVTGVTWVVWQVPHSHCFVVDRFTLFKHVERDELHLPADHSLPEFVLLLERPTAEQLNGPRAELLGRYWRLLFHASVHRELDQRLTEVSPSSLRERIDQIGASAFEEARNVLFQDGLLPSIGEDVEAYKEFAAYFLELRFFNPALIPVCFPSLPPGNTVDDVIARDVDGARLFQQTRPADIPDPKPKTDDQSDESHDYYYRLVRAAARASKSGDTVQAAILHTKAARVAPAALTGPAQASARNDIYTLVERLRNALDMTDAEAEPWKEVLPRLLDKADQGSRPVEAALLYDLQRACIDHEEKIYALDIGEWLLSGTRRSIKRELTSQRFVRVPAQLRSSARRLSAARLSDADRKALGDLLRDAQNRAEEQLRQKFRPILRDALLDAGLRPGLLPEETALKKTVEELLDRISSAGFLAFGDVRDAIARGQMKLPDMGGPNEYVRGDSLLRLDSRLATELDGVYRRAESYTRWLERLTAFNFGTETGRWLTRNVTAPFGLAFLVAQFIWLLVYERWSREVAAAVEESQPALSAAGGVSSLELGRPSFFGGWNAEWWFHLAWIGLGALILLVIQSAEVRAVLRAVGRTFYRGARFIFWDIPQRVWSNPWVRRLVGSVPVQFAINYVIKPVIVSLLVWVIFPDLWEAGWPARLITVIASGFLVNSRPGRAAQTILHEALRGFVELVRSAPAVFRWINDIFRDFVYVLEWVLVRTEDWLRLRGKAGPFAITVKAMAGLVWWPFAFFIRFYTVVLIEPMLNPLKLPLSILFAKFVYPLLLLFPGVLQADPTSFLGYSSPLVHSLEGILGRPAAWLLVMGTLWLLPDAVTFLFWEMRENWRLYRANRPAVLRSVGVGPHGERVRGLLHWGFHSGTVPRQYAKLRAAEREASQTDNWRDARNYRAALRDVEEAVQRFVTRDFTEVLNRPESRWGGPILSVGTVTLGTNRIRLEIIAEDFGPSAWLEWEDRSGWLVAGWAEPGFLSLLPREQADSLEDALAYLYRRAGVDVVREQVRAELPKEAKHSDIGPDGLLVWYGTRESPPLLYDLGDPAAELHPQTAEQHRPVVGPTLDGRRLIFARVQLTWPQWIDVWRPRPPGEPRPRFGPSDFAWSLLPPRDETSPADDFLSPQYGRSPNGPPPLPPLGLQGTVQPPTGAQHLPSGDYGIDGRANDGG